MSASLLSLPQLPPESLSSKQGNFQPKDDWERDFIQWLRFLPIINNNKGQQNCDACALQLNDILNNGVSEHLKPVTTKKSKLYTFDELDDSGKIIGSYIYDSRVLERCKVKSVSFDDFIYCEEQGLEDFRLVEIDSTSMEIDGTTNGVKKKHKPEKLACYSTTLETFAEDLLFFNKRKGTEHWKIENNRICNNANTGHGIVIATYRKQSNPGNKKSTAHILNYVVGPGNQVIFIDAQQNTISRTISLEEFTEELFFLPSVPPEGFIFKKEKQSPEDSMDFNIKKEKPEPQEIQVPLIHHEQKQAREIQMPLISHEQKQGQEMEYSVEAMKSTSNAQSGQEAQAIKAKDLGVQAILGPKDKGEALFQAIANRDLNALNSFAKEPEILNKLYLFKEATQQSDGEIGEQEFSQPTFEAPLYVAATTSTYEVVDALIKMGARVFAAPFLVAKPLLERIRLLGKPIDKRIVERLESALLTNIGLKDFRLECHNNTSLETQAFQKNNFNFLLSIVLCKPISDFRKAFNDVTLNPSFFVNNIFSNSYFGNFNFLYAGILSGSIKILDETLSLAREILDSMNAKTHSKEQPHSNENFKTFERFFEVKAGAGNNHADYSTYLLEFAAQCGYVEMFNHLNSLFPELYPKTRKYVLRGAMKGGHLAMIRLLHEKDPELLHESFQFQSLTSISSISIVDKRQKNAIYFALDYNRPKALELLIELAKASNKSILDAEFEDGNLLWHAILLERPYMAEKILNEHPILLYKPDKSGQTAFLKACQTKNKTHAIQYLLKKDGVLRKELLNSVSAEGVGCFQFLAQSGYFEILQDLISQNAMQNPLFYAKDKFGRNLLHYAIMGNSIVTVETLLKNPEIYKKLLNERSLGGNGNVHYASMCSLEALKFFYKLDPLVLLERGKNGMTTLMFAAGLPTLRRNESQYLAKVDFIVRRAPLLSSLNNSQESVFSLLLRDRTQLEKELADGKTASQETSLLRQLGYLKQCQSLLEAHANKFGFVVGRNSLQAAKFKELTDKQAKIASQNVTLAKGNQRIISKKIKLIKLETQIAEMEAENLQLIALQKEANKQKSLEPKSREEDNGMHSPATPITPVPVTPASSNAIAPSPLLSKPASSNPIAPLPAKRVLSKGQSPIFSDTVQIIFNIPSKPSSPVRGGKSEVINKKRTAEAAGIVGESAIPEQPSHKKAKLS